MSLHWSTATLRPIAIGGAATCFAEVSDTTGSEVLRVLVKLGPAVTWDDPSVPSVELHGTGHGQWRGIFFGEAPIVVTVAWFAETKDGWFDGPLVFGVSLKPSFDVHVPWVKGWMVERLLEVARSLPPFSNGKTLGITVAFPRSIQGLPSLNVQIDSLMPSSVVDGDLLGGDAQVGGVHQRGRLYNITLSLVGWCTTPEERDRLSR
jgi:hypothetical protein